MKFVPIIASCVAAANHDAAYAQTYLEAGTRKKPIIQWTERDLFMEEIHMTPTLDHYFRDWRGGVDFWLDAVFKNDKLTDGIVGLFKEGACSTCKVASITLQTTLD